MEKEKIKEKKIDILALWRSFITPAVEEASTEEVILNDSKLSETKKKELLKTLNKCDTIMGKMSKSYTKDLKVDPKTLLNEKEIISKNIPKSNSPKRRGIIYVNTLILINTIGIIVFFFALSKFIFIANFFSSSVTF